MTEPGTVDRRLFAEFTRKLDTGTEAIGSGDGRYDGNGDER